MNWIPKFAIPIGSRNVPIADPNLLIDVASPTPVDRISVGKLSAGNTPTKLLTADIIKVKMAKESIISTVALLGRTLRRERVTINTIKEEIKNPLRENLTVNQIPKTAPAISRPFNRKSVP